MSEIICCCSGKPQLRSVVVKHCSIKCYELVVSPVDNDKDTDSIDSTVQYYSLRVSLDLKAHVTSVAVLETQANSPFFSLS